jgi:hypothetical protein
MVLTINSEFFPKQHLKATALMPFASASVRELESVSQEDILLCAKPRLPVVPNPVLTSIT